MSSSLQDARTAVAAAANACLEAEFPAGGGARCTRARSAASSYVSLR